MDLRLRNGESERELPEYYEAQAAVTMSRLPCGQPHYTD
jgi:hypothetical protein